jgi:hypothetical protein
MRILLALALALALLRAEALAGKPREPLGPPDPGPAPEQPLALETLCGDAPEGYLPDLQLLDGDGKPEVLGQARPDAWPGAEIRIEVLNRGKRSSCAGEVRIALTPQTAEVFGLWDPYCPLGRRFKAETQTCVPIHDAFWPPASAGPQTDIVCPLPQLAPLGIAACRFAVFARERGDPRAFVPGVAELAVRIPDGLDADAAGNALAITVEVRLQ